MCILFTKDKLKNILNLNIAKSTGKHFCFTFVRSKMIDYIGPDFWRHSKTFVLHGTRKKEKTEHVNMSNFKNIGVQMWQIVFVFSSYVGQTTSTL